MREADERGVPGAKVVDRQADAELAEAGEHAGGALGVGQPREPDIRTVIAGSGTSLRGEGRCSGRPHRRRGSLPGARRDA
jgi:hypothetical protein